MPKRIYKPTEDKAIGNLNRDREFMRWVRANALHIARQRELGLPIVPLNRQFRDNNDLVTM